ncbi:hypothetical protein AZE42_07978 [Rhizopogon vesiculosus]|uniref:DUF6533 domain-containing protein n=1 Tax=Rhizopogon vesiculosus TaxID=180088 RepID=A0A1J8Q8R5_9AGAM|nr:hypothetical protein AZE42_07978 [Rhizopogon vesiculosus]
MLQQLEQIVALRWNNYISVANFTVMSYDYLLLFEKEVKGNLFFVGLLLITMINADCLDLQKRQWSMMSGLYLVVRYLGLFVAVYVAELSFTLLICTLTPTPGLVAAGEVCCICLNYRMFQAYFTVEMLTSRNLSSCYGLIVLIYWGYSAYFCFAEGKLFIAKLITPADFSSAAILIWRLYAISDRSKRLLRPSAFSVDEVVTPTAKYCTFSFNMGPMPAVYTSIPIICYDIFLVVLASATLVKHLKERRDIKMRPNTYVLLIVRYHIIYFILNLTNQVLMTILWANIPRSAMSLSELFNDTVPFLLAPRLIISIWDTHADDECVYVSTRFADCACWTSPPIPDSEEQLEEMVFKSCEHNDDLCLAHSKAPVSFLGALFEGRPHQAPLAYKYVMSEQEFVANLRWNDNVSVATITLIFYDYRSVCLGWFSFLLKWVRADYHDSPESLGKTVVNDVLPLSRSFAAVGEVCYICLNRRMSQVCSIANSLSSHLFLCSCYDLVVLIEWGFSVYFCFAEVILIWRLYALYGRSKHLLHVLLGLFSLVVALSVAMDIYLYSRPSAFSGEFWLASNNWLQLEPAPSPLQVKELITQTAKYCTLSFKIGPMPAIYTSIPIVCYDIFLAVLAAAVLVKHLKERKSIKWRPNTYVVMIVRYHIIYFVLNMTNQILLVILWADIPTPAMSLSELFNDTAPFIFAPRLIISIWDTHAHEKCIHVNTTFADCVCWTSLPMSESEEQDMHSQITV